MYLCEGMFLWTRDNQQKLLHFDLTPEKFDMAQKNATSCQDQEAAVLISNTLNILLDHNELVSNLILGDSTSN